MTTPVDLTKLPDYLKQQRWFSGKAWPIKSVSVVDHATLDFGACSFTLAIVEVLYELGHPERYLLPDAAAGTGHQGPLAIQSDHVASTTRRGARASEHNACSTLTGAGAP